MKNGLQHNGSTAIAALADMDAWEANIVLNMRLWWEGPLGQMHVRRDYVTALPPGLSDVAWRAFDAFMRKVDETSWRPMLRRRVTSGCVGSDECVLLHLIRTASDGHLIDAALIASLMVGATHAEHVALMAGDVGSRARHMHSAGSNPSEPTARAAAQVH